MRLADRYRLLRKVGAGGDGGVYLVEDRLADDGLRALKRLHPDAQAGLAPWLVNEFQILAQIDLPTVARVYDFGVAEPDGEDPGGTFFTRAYVDGVPLDDALRAPDDGTDVIRTLFASAAGTLRELHRLGVVHGDLKPANLIVPPPRDTVVLIDFGLAHGALALGTSLRGGTLAFMPPERAARFLAGDPLPPDPRADVYGLAASLLCVLGADTVDAPPPATVTSRPPLRALWDIGHRGASPDPARRFASMDDFLVALGDRVTPVRPRGTRVVLRPEGRAGELGALLDAVARRLVRREPGDGAVLLVGEEGSGRSTLLRELTWRAQLRGVQVLALQGEPGDGPTRRLLAAGAILAGEALAPPTSQGILHALGSAARHGPVLLLADDLDLADPAIASVLRTASHAVSSVGPLLVIATASDEARVRAFGPALTVRLGPLDESAVADLCAQTLGAVEPAVVSAVHRRTRGLPLAVTEVLHALAREAAVTPADVEGMEVRGRARDIASARVAALSDAAREAATVVAALGSEADDARVHALTRHQGLVEARAGSVVGKSANGRWRVAQGALVEALLAAPTGEVLQRVAETLDATGAPVTVRAMAWVRANSPSRGPIADAVTELAAAGLPLAAAGLLAAVREKEHAEVPAAALLREAELLHEGGMVAEAEALAERVGEGTADDVHARALLLRGRLRRLAGDLSGAEALLARVAASADGEKVAEARVECARVAMARGDYGAVARLCDAGLPSDVRPTVRAAAQALAGIAAVYTGEIARGIEGIEAARAVYTSLALVREETALLVYLAVARERSGDLAGARALHEQSLERARAAGDLRAMASARINLGHIAQRTGELGAAIEHNEAALALAQRAGLHTEALTARVNMAGQLLRVGSLDRARVELEAAILQARETGHRDLAAAATLMLGVAHARSGDADGGLAKVSEAYEAFTALGQADDAVDALLDEAEILVIRAGAGDVERAGVGITRARAGTGAGGGLGLREARARMLEGRVALGRGDAQEALRVLEGARVQAEAAGDWEVHAEALAAEAMAHASTGAEVHARRVRERAVEVLEERAGMLPLDLRGAFWGVGWRADLRARVTGARSGRGAEPREGMAGTAPTLIAKDDRLVLLLEMSRRVGEEHTLERVLDQAVRSAVELTGAERGAVLLPGVDGGLEVRVRSGGVCDDGPDESFSRSIAESVWIDGEPVVTMDARGDRRFADFRSVHDLGIAAVAAVPVRSRGRTLGVLYVENRRRTVAWTTADVALMSAFAEQSGVAVEHARLVEELEARGRELERARGEIEALLETRTTELEDTRRSLARAQEALQKHFAPEGMVSRSEVMRRLFAVIDRVRESDVPVVIEGESGTGKDLVARAMHFSGARAKGPFVVIHCGAIPETLLESELFGHVRGAFTGADRDRKGLVASANGGTLLLDEVTEMSPRMQVELLRVLQERKVRPVGAEAEETVDVRILVASSRPLKDMVAEGRFREDLYYRLAVVTLRVPPLRERLEDIPALAQHVLTGLAAEHGGVRRRLSRDAVDKLTKGSWPGNVRQLRHAIESAAILCEGDVIEASAIAVSENAWASTLGQPSETPPTLSASALRRAAERQKIVNALEDSNWNKVRAAEVLGIPRRTFYRRLRDYGLLD